MQEIMLALLVAVNQYVLISKQIYIMYSLDSIYSFYKRNYLHINNYLQNHQAPWPSTCPPSLATQSIVRLCISRTARVTKAGCSRKAFRTCVVLCVLV